MDFKSVHEESATNAQIAAGGTAFEILLSTNAAKQATSKYQQSFNAVEINNNSNSVILNLDFDGLNTRRRILFPKNSLVIEAKDGIFFNVIKVINTHAADALAAGECEINARILKQVRGV